MAANSRSPCFLPAFLAHTVQFQPVGGYRESVFLSHIMLQFFDLTVLEFDDPSTFLANQVVMVFGFIDWLVSRYGMAEHRLIGQPPLLEKFERPVYCRVTYPALPLLDLVVKFFDREVSARLNKEVDHKGAFVRTLESVFCPVFDEILQSPRLFAHVHSSEMKLKFIFIIDYSQEERFVKC